MLPACCFRLRCANRLYYSIGHIIRLDATPTRAGKPTRQPDLLMHPVCFNTVAQTRCQTRQLIPTIQTGRFTAPIQLTHKYLCAAAVDLSQSTCHSVRPPHPKRCAQTPCPTSLSITQTGPGRILRPENCGGMTVSTSLANDRTL